MFDKKEYYKKWRKKNLKKMKLYMRKYRKEHPETIGFHSTISKMGKGRRIVNVPALQEGFKVGTKVRVLELKTP